MCYAVPLELNSARRGNSSFSRQYLHMKILAVFSRLRTGKTVLFIVATWEMSAKYKCKGEYTPAVIGPMGQKGEIKMMN